MNLRGALRATAILIAAGGAIDPAITRTRTVPPDVSLVAADHLPDPALVERVARALTPDAVVVRGPSLGAAAIVSVGYARPIAGAAAGVPSFAVVPAPATPYVGIASVAAPARAPLDARVPIVVRAHTVAARGRALRVMLQSGDLTRDEATTTVETDDGLMTATLSLVSETPGSRDVTVIAQIDGTSSRHEVPVTIEAARDRQSVLVFDARPSWHSTFVRRAAEADPQFMVTSRTRTSRGASVAAGRPPAGLDIPEALDEFNLVVVGAPSALSAREATAIETFLRAGGRVVLLQDEPAASPALQQLTGITQWTDIVRPEPAGMPRATESFHPAALPPWATPAVSESRNPEPPNPEPEYFAIPVGAGRLFVTTALDAWRFRGEDGGAFDRLWRERLASAARTSGRAATEPWAAARGLARDERPLLAARTSATGGTVVSERELDTLAAAVMAAVAPGVERRRVYPFRSPWWIVPFGLALAAEWWGRRREGLR